MRVFVVILIIGILAISQGCTRFALLSSSGNNVQSDTDKAPLISNFSIESNPFLTELDVTLANGALTNVLNNYGARKIDENWRNPWNGHAGEITPSTHFWVNQTFCINYIHRYKIEDLTETQQGVACKKDVGSWLDYS